MILSVLAMLANKLGRVAKASIPADFREARREDAARRLEGMKKDEMAKAAEGLVAGAGWLLEPLRTLGVSKPPASEVVLRIDV